MNKLFGLSDFVNSFVYRTERGDTVRSISEKFGVCVNKLVSVNALDREPEEGDVLLIEKSGGREYVVKPGDTILSIAGYDRDAALKISADNAVDYVYAGQKIYV